MVRKLLLAFIGLGGAGVVVVYLLTIPYYVVLFFLEMAAVVAVVIAWFALLFTGRYPKGIFDFVVGVFRWHNRVIA